MADTFTCYNCHETFDKGWSDEEMHAEAVTNFGHLPPEEAVTVCDDCYTKIMVFNKGESVVRFTSEQLREAFHRQAMQRVESQQVDRTQWTRQQWVDDARELMNHIDGAITSLVNGHIMALIETVDAVNREPKDMTDAELNAEIDQIHDRIDMLRDYIKGRKHSG